MQERGARTLQAEGTAGAKSPSGKRPDMFEERQKVGGTEWSRVGEVTGVRGCTLSWAVRTTVRTLAFPPEK